VCKNYNLGMTMKDAKIWICWYMRYSCEYSAIKP